MLDRENVKRVLEKFGDDVISEARRNFKDKDASGKGSRSLNHEINVFKSSIGMYFEMQKYMEFQDKGVSGTKRKFNTPYSYNNKKPPTKVFDKWVIRRGIAARDKKGRFLSRENLKFALSNYIFKFGIKPSLFFTKAFEKHFKDLPDEIIEAYGLDLERLMETSLNAK